jgi:putative ABC transport system permease protein
MVRSFFILTVRNLFRRNLLFTLINIAGLAVGLCCLLLAALFVYDEHTFDAHNTKATRIFRVVVDFKNEGTVVNWARSSAAIGHYLAGTYPEIEHVVRIRKNPGTDLMSKEEIKFYEERVFFADSTLLNVFDVPLSKGNPSTALSDKNSIVLTEETARKYFGNSDPIGQSIRFNNQVDLKITGIMEPMPSNSHFVADGFITFSTLDDLFGEKRLMHWGQFDHHTYLLLKDVASARSLESKFPDFLKTYAPEWVLEKEELFLQSLLSIHLNSNRKDEIGVNSDAKYSYLLGTIAMFILVMACCNFINLSTAIQSGRFKELGIQKILGANKRHLIVYYWFASLMLCVLSFIVAIAFAYVMLPYFNSSTGKQLSLFQNVSIVAGVLNVALVIGLLAGIFPTIQSTKINLVSLGKGGRHTVNSKSLLRNSLVTFQFFISILLIIITLTVTSQSDFLESSRVGFIGDNVLVIPVKDRSKNDRHATITSELQKLPGVHLASFCSSTPGSNTAFTYTYSFEGTTIKDQTISTFIVDDNFISLFDIKIIDGRSLTSESKDTLVDVVLNESAVRQFNLRDPIGQIVGGKVKGRVVGVVKDFNHTSLRSAIDPVIMFAFPPTFRTVSVKYEGGDSRKVIKALEAKWPELYPGYPLEHSFLDDQINLLHSSEIQLTRGYKTFSIVAIIIAGIGLIGLTTYLLRRKLREISIRRVFGSSTRQIVFWIYSANFKMILIASVLAWAAGYYLMNEWLKGFSHRIDLEVTDFLFPPILMTIVLLLTTGFQSIKAAGTNPVENLREE